MATIVAGFWSLMSGTMVAMSLQAIGRITATPGLQALDEAGASLDLAGWAAFDHFKS